MPFTDHLGSPHHLYHIIDMLILQTSDYHRCLIAYSVRNILQTTLYHNRGAQKRIVLQERVVTMPQWVLQIQLFLFVEKRRMNI